MVDLVAIEKCKVGEQMVEAVNARELHGFLESRQDFSDWIKARINQYGFVKGADFSDHNFMVSGKGNLKSNRIDYYITLDMAKEHFHVCHDIRKMFERVEIDERKFASVYTDAKK